MSIYDIVAPDYYKDFSCKCSDCRNTCCTGWGISVSESEYFRLIGMDCESEMRHKLDCAFHMADDPCEERYALISPDFRGNCPLISDNGLCRLQLSCGESVLPRICRQYPRAFRGGDRYEICASGSCERTIELLCSSTEPLTFIGMSVDLPYEPVPPFDAYAVSADGIRIRKMCEDIMSDRTLTLEERIAAIGEYVCGGDASVCAKDLLERSCVSALRLVRYFEKHSASIASLGSDAIALLCDASGSPDAEMRFDEILKRVHEKMPDFDIYIEKIMMNHLFYEQFPYVLGRENLRSAYFSLCAAFCMTKLLVATHIFSSPTPEHFADAAAAVFRLVEHSDFYEIAGHIFTAK